MSDSRKYYYLKLKDNFFDSEEIKAIEAMPSGHEFVVILLKMYLRSLKRDGKLMVTDAIPYDKTTLAGVLGHKLETIEKAVMLFHEFGLIEIMSGGQMYIAHIQNFIGESSTEADRKREYRRRIDDDKKLLADNGGTMSGQMSDKPPPELERELERELDIYSEGEKDKRPFIPASEAHGNQSTGIPEHVRLAVLWFAELSKQSANPIGPNQRQKEQAREALEVLGGDGELFTACVRYYWENCTQLWWYKENRKHNFGSFTANIAEIVPAAGKHIKEDRVREGSAEYLKITPIDTDETPF